MAERMSKWNHRIFRCAAVDGSSYYEVRETHYDDANKITGWSMTASAPFGATARELINDMAWMMSALVKPILDDKTGEECEPAQMLADDLQRWVDARTTTAGEA